MESSEKTAKSFTNGDGTHATTTHATNERNTYGIRWDKGGFLLSVGLEFLAIPFFVNPRRVNVGLSTKKKHAPSTTVATSSSPKALPRSRPPNQSNLAFSVSRIVLNFMASYLTKHGVDVVEMWLSCVGDKELALVGVWPLTCHRYLRARVGSGACTFSAEEVVATTTMN